MINRDDQASSPQKRILIVGSPNVGKSVLFGLLTGKYVTVSNYPGTTIELSKGQGQIASHKCEIIDTPGMYSFLPVTEEEEVAKSIILEGAFDLVLHVIDAKNAERMVPLTMQLRMTGCPVILVANMMDEAKLHGVELNISMLARKLDLPVVGTVMTRAEGIETLKKEMCQALEHDKKSDVHLSLPAFEEGYKKIREFLSSTYPVDSAFLSMMMLQDDQRVLELVSGHEEPDTFQKIMAIVEQVRSDAGKEPIHYQIALAWHQQTKDILNNVITVRDRQSTFMALMGRLMMKPLTGIPILLIILYFGLYKFVGGFGAGTVVDFLENGLFMEYIIPPVEGWVRSILPWVPLQNLIVGEYGVFSLGVRYAFAMILPIVATFFFAFAIIEDSGYLPRLAMLLDRIFKKLGLSGRAVIPMVLGLGCDTMATIVTRTLPTRRERVISTLLLSLAVPCSAQLGVILGILSVNAMAFGVWVFTLGGVFILIGYLAAKVMPGEKAIFFMEVPPLRLPTLSNVMVKTTTRMQWYFKEVFPVFILASILLWFLELIGALEVMTRWLELPMKWLGLPLEASHVFLYGFFRRDYGAAGLYDMNSAGVLSAIQLVVAAVTLSLFIPCIAQFIINIKERGLKVGLSMSLFVFCFAFFVGIILNKVLLVVKII